MPRNASGTYTLPPSNPVIADTPILASGWANPTLDDIAAALTDSISKNGVTTPSADLPMGGRKHLAVGVATALDQYVRASQSQTAALIQLSSVSMPVADAYIATLVLAATSFVKGQLVICEFPAANVGPATININGAGVRSIVKANGAALTANTIKTNQQFFMIYDGTNWRLFIDATGISSAEVIASLGYTPVNPNGSVPMTGQLTVVDPPVNPTDAASKDYVDTVVGSIPVGVLSFNSRTGTVTLISGDVTGALGYTPLNKAGDTFGGNMAANNFDLLGAKNVGFASQVDVTPTTGSIAVNFNLGQKRRLVMTGNASALTFTFPAVGHYQLVIISGAFTITWPTPGATWQWLNATSAPTLNTGTYGGCLSLYWDGTMALAAYNKIGAI